MERQTRKEINFVTGCQMFIEDVLLRGCLDLSLTHQTDPGNGKTLDLCRYNLQGCPFYDGPYVTRGQTVPNSKLDKPIPEGTVVGVCRLHNDAVRLGPFILFDKAPHRQRNT